MKISKVVIVIGTRPNFIKVTQFGREFEKHKDRFEYKLVHTGQHYDPEMSHVFFEQLGLKEPDIYLNIKEMDPASQVGHIITELAGFFSSYRPDLVMVVGDVNSTLAAALAAKKTGAKIAHLESGLRSRDLGMPEEINRMLTDRVSDLFFITEQSGYDNLQEEMPEMAGGFHFVGNTMIDTLIAFEPMIQSSTVMENYNLEDQQFGLITIHRPQNVDEYDNLVKVVKIIQGITNRCKLVFPIHPRTKQRLEETELMEKLRINTNLIISGPLDYFAFQKLIAGSKFVLTDSGGIQEETTFRKVPCITLRPNTERPSTIQVGTNVMADLDVQVILEYVENIFNGTFKRGEIPRLWDGMATKRIVEVLGDTL